MGELAEYWNNQGEEMYWLHLLGDCGSVGPCPYCYDRRKGRKRMPAKTVKSDFAKSMGTINTAVKKAAKEKTTYGQQPLPPGITDGVAELDVCEFGKVKDGAKNAGKWYFRMAGTVLKPSQFVGRKTDQFVGLYDQGTGDKKRTRDDMVGIAMNLMRQLAGEDYTEDAETAEDLERLANDLLEKRPKFKFSTSGGGTYMNTTTKKEQEGKIFHNWHGTEGVDQDDEIPADGGTEEDVEEEEVPPPKKAATKPAGKPVISTNGKPGKKKTTEPVEEEEEVVEEDDIPFDEGENDLTLLVLVANGKESEERTEAQSKLEELAKAAGYSQKDIDGAENWQAVADMCGGSAGDEEIVKEEEETSEEETEEIVPEVGGLFQYQEMAGGKPAVDTKGKPKKPVEVEVIKVFTEKKLVYLKRNQDQKTLLGKDGTKSLAVAWDKLIPIED